MSVIVTLIVRADAGRLESWAADNGETLKGILEQAKSHGAIAHRFYGSHEGNIMVLDEWPDRESFESFFHASQGEIQPMMEAVGAEGMPQISFWRELDMPDKLGWGA